ncbi:MAG: hypothetical protein KAG93_06485 [Desulfuromusa sp.]|nr:hypothetical protein [Desulfuromusa sp.]
MAIDDLVQTIVREVLRQLQQTAAAPPVLILARPDEKKVPPVLASLGSNQQIVYWDSVEMDMNPERVIVPFLSCSQMADLALGRATDPLQTKILDFLLAGHGVEIFEFEYHQFTTTAPAALLQLYESYEETLRGFGLQQLGSADEGSTRLNLPLITEKDVIEASQQGVSVLRLRSDVQLTPLAIDSAKERGIQLQKEERRDK